MQETKPGLLCVKDEYLLLEYDFVRACISRLAGDTETPTRRFIVLLFAFCGAIWIVPAVLSCASGAFSPAKELTFSYVGDLSVIVLLFFSLPVLLASARAFSSTQNRVLGSLRRQGTFQANTEQYRDAVRAANRGLQSRGIHGIALFLGLIFSVAWMYTILAYETSSWHCVKGNGIPSYALLFVTLVSFPIALYVIFAWFWKAFVWMWFIRRICKYGLFVNHVHPDGVGGMRIFRYTSLAWGTFIVCVGLTVAGDTINYASMTPPEYSGYIFLVHHPLARWDIVAKLLSYCMIAPVVFLGPLLLITPHLWKCRREGEMLMSEVALRFSNGVTSTTRKEMDSDGDLTSANVQVGWSGMYNLSAMYQNMRSMHLWPFDLRSIAQMAAAVIGPLLPLLAKHLGLIERIRTLLLNQ